MADQIQQLLRHSAENGLPLPEDLQLDGTLRRYCKDGSRERDEWYIGFHDGGFVHCTYGSWSLGEKFTFRSAEKLTPEQKERIEEYHRERAKRLKEMREEASEKAGAFYEKCESCHTHPYLDRKRVKVPEGVRKQHRGGLEWLVVPIRDYGGAVMSCERIAPDGTKRSFPGAPKRAGWFTFEGGKETIRLCEGFATAATVAEATKDTTLCCFGLGNLGDVLAMAKKKWPKARFVICADAGSEKEVDKLEAKVSIAPGEKGTDYNDIARREGIEAVKALLEIKTVPSSELSEFLALDIPEPEPLVEGFLHVGGLYFVRGPTGACKSLFTQELSFALAEASNGRDRQIFLKYQVPQPRRVLYIDSELPPALLLHRIKMTAIRRQSDIKDGYYRLISRHHLAQMDSPLNLYSPAHRTMLEELFEHFDVIFIDNLQNTTVDTEHQGLENEATFWQTLNFWFRKWQDRGKTFFVTHHESKGGTMRGTSRMSQDADDVIHVTEPKTIPEKGVAFDYRLEKTRWTQQQGRKKQQAHLSDEHSEKMHLFNWKITQI